jgi:hypothetical protein
LSTVPETVLKPSPPPQALNNVAVNAANATRALEVNCMADFLFVGEGRSLI